MSMNDLSVFEKGILMALHNNQGMSQGRLLDLIPQEIIKVSKNPDDIDMVNLFSDEKILEQLEGLEEEGLIGVRHEVNPDSNVPFLTTEGEIKLNKIKKETGEKEEEEETVNIAGMGS